MLVAWHPTKLWDQCVPKDKKKKEEKNPSFFVDKKQFKVGIVTDIRLKKYVIRLLMLLLNVIKIKKRSTLSFTFFLFQLIPQPTRDVLVTSRKGPLNVLTSETSRGPLGDSQGTNKKIDDLREKVFFRCNSLCFTHLLLTFTGKTNIQKF